MAGSKKNFFKDHYDWLVAVIGLALLAGVGFLFATSLGSSPESARADCEGELKMIKPAHEDVPIEDLSGLTNVLRGMKSPAPLASLSDKEGSFLASECRVFCKNPDLKACHKPIPYKSKVCPFCGFKQPVEKPEDAVRGGSDTDLDGMPDAWELKYGLNPTDPSDANIDSDGDTFTNLEEFKAKTNPKNPDSHPDYLDYLTISSDLRTEKLPFWFKMANPIRNGYRLTFEVPGKKYKNVTTALIGEEVVYRLANPKFVKGRMQDDKVKSGWRVVKYNAKEERVLKKGSEQKTVVDVSTVDLERIKDKRMLSARVRANPVAVEEQIDLYWSREGGKTIAVSEGTEFSLKDCKYKVKKLSKTKVSVIDLKTNELKIIGAAAAAENEPEPKTDSKAKVSAEKAKR